MCYSIAQSIESLFFLALQCDLFDIAAFGISLGSLLDAASKLLIIAERNRLPLVENKEFLFVVGAKVLSLYAMDEYRNYFLQKSSFDNSYSQFLLIDTDCQ